MNDTITEPQSSESYWIWTSDTENARNYFTRARKLFKLSAKAASASIKVTACTEYKLYVNGEYVGKGPVPSVPGETSYDVYDIAAYLARGRNVIAILAHYIGEETPSRALVKPGIICKGEIVTSKETVFVGSNDTWLVNRAKEYDESGERMSSGLGFQEIYDCANCEDGWNEVRFKDKYWQPATVVGMPPCSPWGRLFERPIPALREEATYPVAITGVYNSAERTREVPASDIPALMAQTPLTNLRAGSISDPQVLTQLDTRQAIVKTSRDGRGVTVVLDFGREVYGNVEVGIAGSGVGIIDLGYGECLRNDRVMPDAEGTNYTDRILLKKGQLHWQSFQVRAFRYLQIEFRWLSKAVGLEYVRVNQTTYPVGTASSFECSDETLNAIWTAGAYTTQLCMQEMLVDSPRHERSQWWPDARILARSAYYAFGDTTLLKQGLKQLAATQRKDGLISGSYPVESDQPLADLSMLWTLSIFDYCAFSGDLEIVKELYPTLKRLVKWFESLVDSDGFLNSDKVRLFIDYAETEKRGEVTAFNSLYYQTLQIAAVAASICERDVDAQAFLEASDKLKRAMNKLLFLPEAGVFADNRVGGKLGTTYSVQSNVFAALFDVTDFYRKSSILRYVLTNWTKQVDTPYFTSYLLEALYTADKHSEALDIIRKYWGRMVANGPTTLWERFDDDSGLCRSWAVSPVRDLMAEYLGLKPVLGSGRFALAPHPSGLDWAKGTIHTPQGPLTAEWSCEPNVMSISVNIPADVIVDLYPPGDIGCSVYVNDRKHAGRLVVLRAGMHLIRVERSSASVTQGFADSLKPPESDHVIVLDAVSQLGRTSRRSPETRTRRKTKTDDEAEVTTVISDESGTASTDLETKKLPKKRASRSRTKKRIDADATIETPTAAAEVPAETTEEIVPSDSETSEVIAVTDENAVPTTPKRRPRRRSRRKKTVDVAEISSDVSPQIDGTPETQVASEAVPSEQTLELVMQVADDQASESVSSDEMVDVVRKRRRRRSHRSKNWSSDQPVGTDETTPASTDTNVEEVQVAAQEVAPEESGTESSLSEASPAKPRRRRRRSSAKKPTTTEDGTSEAPEIADSAPVTIEAAPEASMENVDDSAPKKRPSRPRRRRRKPTEQPGQEPQTEESTPSEE